MQNTVQALAELRMHWKSIGCPSIPQIAKKANVPVATAYRYVTGATKGGMAETIRALAIAMDRRDIADSIPYTSIGTSEHTEDYLVEFSQQMQEKFNQQLNEVTAKHKQELDRTFAQTIKIHHREKWIAYALLLAAVAALILK